MQPVLEGEFEENRPHDSDLPEAIDAVTSGVAIHNAANQGALIEPEHTATEQAASVKFDVAELQAQLELRPPETFNPDHYTQKNVVDRAVIGYRDGKPVYKTETDEATPPNPIPKPNRLSKPYPKLAAQRATTDNQTQQAKRRNPRARRASESNAKKPYRSSHQLYQDRHKSKPHEALGEYVEIGAYDTLNKWVIKSTHVAAIVVALLLILHYFPLPKI